jgi:hypothetical protein
MQALSWSVRVRYTAEVDRHLWITFRFADPEFVNDNTVVTPGSAGSAVLKTCWVRSLGHCKPAHIDLVRTASQKSLKQPIQPIQV